MAVANDNNPNIVGNYEIGALLGKGSFGEVKIATHIPTSEKFAIKIVSTEKMAQADLDKEIVNQRRLSHKHVVRIHEVIQQDSLTFIVMELVSGGDLFDHMVKQPRLRENEARRIFQQIIAGVEHCHDSGVAHRDLKPENIFMDHGANIKIGDFGLSGEIREGELLRDSCGSMFYAAPELLSKNCAYEGPEVDVWACGVILYALLANRLPFDKDSPRELARAIKKGEYAVPGFFSDDAKDLVNRILSVDRAQRLSIADIQGHKWFQVDLPLQVSSDAVQDSDSDSDISDLGTPAVPTKYDVLSERSQSTEEPSNESDKDISSFATSSELKTSCTSGLEVLDCLEASLQPVHDLQA